MEVQAGRTKKKPSKLEDMTKEQIRQAILKKRECNAKALTIVENLLEKGISETYFIQCLPDINQSHFEDIIEERAVTKVCGYPICSNDLSEKEIPKQKYRISMKTNKVYDITARKSFCSNVCYQAAMHVKNQMLTSPLWFREYEEIPQFNILHASEPARMGLEVDVALVERVTPNPVHPFIPINEFASASLKDLTGDLETGKHKHENKEEEIGNKNAESVKKKKTEESSNLEEEHCEQSSNLAGVCAELAKVSVTSAQDSQNKNPEVKQQKKIKNPLNIVGEIIERPEQKIDPILTETTVTPVTSNNERPQKIFKKKQPMVTALTIQTEKCLAEWFTIDTLLFLFGEVKVKEMVANKGHGIKEYLNNYAKGVFYTSNSYDHYQTLCRKLNMLELEDRQFDAEALKKETKPLPDYSILQEESKRLQLKVRAFYSGETEIPNIESTDEKSSKEGTGLTQLPLVDKHAQHALRRQIVCQHLDKALPDLLQSLGLLTLSMSSDVRSIVNSFNLKANNITFKPIQWTLIAIVITKLLSIKDLRLQYLLQQPKAYQHMQLLLLSYKQEGGYLDRLISWLTDIDRLLDTNDIQLTIE